MKRNLFFSCSTITTVILLTLLSNNLLQTSLAQDSQVLDPLVKSGLGFVGGFIGKELMGVIWGAIFGNGPSLNDIRDKINVIVEELNVVEQNDEKLYNSIQFLASTVEKRLIEEELKDAFSTIKSLSNDVYAFIRYLPTAKYTGGEGDDDVNSDALIRASHDKLSRRIEVHVHAAILRIHASATTFLDAYQRDLINEGRDIFYTHFTLEYAIYRLYAYYKSGLDLLYFAQPTFDYLEGAINSTYLFQNQLGNWHAENLVGPTAQLIDTVLKNGSYQVPAAYFTTADVAMDLTCPGDIEDQCNFGCVWDGNNLRDYYGRGKYPDNDLYLIKKSSRFTLTNPVLTIESTWSTVNKKYFMGIANGKIILEPLLKSKYANTANIEFLFVHKLQRASSAAGGKQSLNPFSIYHPSTGKFIGAPKRFTCTQTWVQLMNSFDSKNFLMFFLNDATQREPTFRLWNPTDYSRYGTFINKYQEPDNNYFSLDFSETLALEGNSSSIYVDWNVKRKNSDDSGDDDDNDSSSTTISNSTLFSQQWLFKQIRPTYYVIINRRTGLALSGAYNRSNPQQFDIIAKPLTPVVVSGSKTFISDSSSVTVLNQEWQLLPSPFYLQSPWNSTWAFTQISPVTKAAQNIELSSSVYDLDFSYIPVDLTLAPANTLRSEQRFSLTFVEKAQNDFVIQNASYYNIIPYNQPSFMLGANVSVSVDNRLQQYAGEGLGFNDASWMFTSPNNGISWNILVSNNDDGGNLYCLDVSSSMNLVLSLCDDSSPTQLWKVALDPIYASLAFKIQNSNYANYYLGNNGANTIGGYWNVYYENPANTNLVSMNRVRLQVASL